MNLAQLLNPDITLEVFDPTKLVIKSVITHEMADAQKLAIERSRTAAGQRAVLCLLAAHPLSSYGDIRTSLNISESGVRKLIGKLMKHGLVKLERSQHRPHLRFYLAK